MGQDMRANQKPTEVGGQGSRSFTDCLTGGRRGRRERCVLGPCAHAQGYGNPSCKPELLQGVPISRSISPLENAFGASSSLSRSDAVALARSSGAGTTCGVRKIN